MIGGTAKVFARNSSEESLTKEIPLFPWYEHLLDGKLLCVISETQPEEILKCEVYK